MTERLLQFIWQFQYFNLRGLSTTSGEELQVITTGQFNYNQGPDFLAARLRMGQTTWAGSVELHIRTSEWLKHQHHEDPNYGNVILHVVWEHDQEINNVPVLELRDRISKPLIQRYCELMNATSFIPCEKNIATIPELNWNSWKERLLAERLLRKAAWVESCLQQNNYHWEEVFWWLLARNFGNKVNAYAFEEMARSIPLNILAKHRNQIHQLEALLFGQVGLLGKKFSEDYPFLLRKEYAFQKRKYGLNAITVPVHFLRMRPVNFPTIRLAQLAMLVHTSHHLFSAIREISDVNDVRKLLAVTANDYWHYHFRFDEPSIFSMKTLGASMIDNIIINTIAPVLFAYGNYYQQPVYKDKSVQWLMDTKAESNSVTRGFKEIGIHSRNSADSQAFLELMNEYCGRKRCLDCAVGCYLLKRKI